MLLKTLQELPKQAGVYQYFDAHKKLLYVGKAKNLFNRVRSYFNFTPELAPKSTLSPRIKKMITQTVYLEYIVVANEHDALILENSLIKQLNPKYNILLRDDKTYPYLLIDHKEPFPRIEITRKVLDDKSLEYFGPLSTGARDIYNALYEILPLVQKRSCVSGGKACLYYQLHKCLAPCENRINQKEYALLLQKARAYVLDKKSLIKELEKKMQDYAQELRFEEAKTLRDQIQSIQKSTLLSTIDLAKAREYDIFAIAQNQTHAVVAKLFMRQGRIISSSFSTLNIQEDEAISSWGHRAILDFYNTHQTLIPKEILVFNELQEHETLQALLSEKKGSKVLLNHPKRGVKKELVELAYTNANEQLKSKKEPKQEPLKKIQELFQLDQTPYRIEVFDNSHLQGVASVGAMVVYDNGRFDKKSYRHFHLKEPNEYAQMQELLSRRIAKFKEEGFPNLWLLDGGATLLKLALKLLNEAHIRLDVLAIAKEKIDAKAHRAKGKAHDIIYTRHEAFKLPSSDQRLLFLQKLRDEAHRFAITFHKKEKLKLDKNSKLLSLAGIGPAKEKKLLNFFGTHDAIKKASIEELRSILNEKDANLIKNHYN